MLYLEIVTPEGIVWKSDRVKSVVVPTKSGEIQILPNHIPLISMIQAGELVVEYDNTVENLAVDKGYIRCLSDRISILAEAAIKLEDINVSEVEEAKDRAIKALEEARRNKYVDDEEIEKLEAMTKFAMAQLLAKRKRM